MYAVVQSGGKQYRVEPGQTIDVERIEADAGAAVELDEVLLIVDGAGVTVGTPSVPGALVRAEVVDHGRDRKVISFKYKAKTRYRRKRGHRQQFTRLAIKEIIQA